MSVAWSMGDVIERPGIVRWTTEFDREGDVQGVEVTSEGVIGETVSELRTELPDNVHLARLTREEENRLPRPDDRIERGDHLTFIGRREAVRAALDYCSTAG